MHFIYIKFENFQAVRGPSAPNVHVFHAENHFPSSSKQSFKNEKEISRIIQNFAAGMWKPTHKTTAAIHNMLHLYWMSVLTGRGCRNVHTAPALGQYTRQTIHKSIYTHTVLYSQPPDPKPPFLAEKPNFYNSCKKSRKIQLAEKPPEKKTFVLAALIFKW